MTNKKLLQIVAVFAVAAVLFCTILIVGMQKIRREQAATTAPTLPTSAPTTLAPTETVFMGNLRPERGTTFPEGAPVDAVGYRFTLRNLENSLSVEAACDRPMEYAVFWSNPDVSCLEPYLPLHLNPGQTARWTLDYHFLSGA